MSATVAETSLGFQQFIALLVDHLALVVGDVVVFQQLLADVEVARFDLALRLLDRARLTMPSSMRARLPAC